MTVRISSNQILDVGVQSMESSMADAMSWNQKITSGQSYSKASDNSYALARGVKLDFDQTRMQMYSSNQNFVSSSLANTDNQLGSVVNQMNALKQLMVQSQNGALNQSDFAALQNAAQGYLDTIKQQAVAVDGTGKKIFPGIVNQVEVEPNVMANTNLKYTDVFGGGGTAKVDVIQKIQDFVDYLGALATGTSQGTNQSNTVTGLETGRVLSGANDANVSGINAQTSAQPGTYVISSQTVGGNTQLFLTDANGAQTRAVTIDPSSTDQTIDFGNGISIQIIKSNGSSDTAQIIAAGLNNQSMTVTPGHQHQSAGSVSSGLNSAFTQLTIMQEAAGSVAKLVDNSKGAVTSIGTQLKATRSALLDTDFTAATAAYTRAQTILNAAEAMFAKISQSNLFSKL